MAGGAESAVRQGASVPVWSWPVRLLHLSFFAGVAAAWLTRHSAGASHEWLGYALGVLLLLRLLYGVLTHGPARFARFVRGPAASWRYALALLRGQAPRYLGHNPLGAWMMVALLSLMLLAVLSGWLATTDRYWGIEWVMNLHAWSATAILWLLPLHIGGALHASFKHRENLIAAMIHGRKRAPVIGDLPP